jgi:hypothetical protein
VPKGFNPWARESAVSSRVKRPKNAGLETVNQGIQESG